MSILVFLFQRIKSLFLIFFGLWRRALCCFRRKRRPSDCLPLTTIDIVNDKLVMLNSPKENEGELNNWTNWDEQSGVGNYKPNTVQEHIEYYRQQAIAARNVSQQSDEEPAPDYFEDMTPKITEQTKIVIKTKGEQSSSQSHNRLALSPEMMTSVNGNQLGEWHESGWEEETSDNWEVDSLLREKRRLEREKQQQRRQQKLSRSTMQQLSQFYGSTKLNT